MNTSMDFSSHLPLLYLYGISSGIVLMAAIYNAVLFMYNKQIMFLYYTLMQISVVFSLIFLAGILHGYESLINTVQFLNFMTIFGVFFSILFTRAFLQTKKYIPLFDKFLVLLICVMLLDFIMLLFDLSDIGDKRFCIGLMSLLLIAGAMRYRQGFQPALYYLLGWSIMIGSIALNVNVDMDSGESFLQTIFLSNPILVGSPFEAILFSLGLFYTVKTTENEKKIQELILIQQAKLVYLGEMLGNISHQWRQPLTNLSYIFMNINVSSDNQSYIKEKADEGMNQLEFMAETIENFRNFYRPDSEKEYFSLHEATQHAVGIIKNELDHHSVSIHIQLVEDTQIYSFKNQYTQVVLNILSNAKEALNASNIDQKHIHIEIFKNKVRISDNGGGIPEKLLHRIFEPYFSTKSYNSGIGLYMSKIIIENNMGGEIKASNTTKGALFELKF